MRSQSNVCGGVLLLKTVSTASSASRTITTAKVTSTSPSTVGKCVAAIRRRATCACTL
jgi:hypothetical protein